MGKHFIAISLFASTMLNPAFATPNIFGESQVECLAISQDRYKSEMEYLEQELLGDNEVLIDAANDVHRLELQACMNSFF